MRKLSMIAALLCIAAMALALTACGNDNKPAETTAAATTEAVTEAPAETEEATEAPAETEEVTEAPAETEEATEAPAETEEAAAAAGGDLTPSIVIEAGDYDAIVDLAQKAQNFGVDEGTVAQIAGTFSTGISNPSIMEPDADGNLKGLTMFVDGDWDAPADKSEIEVIGTFVKGSFYMEFHVSPENITVK